MTEAVRSECRKRVFIIWEVIGKGSGSMKEFKFTYSDEMNVKNFLEDAKKCENEVWFETLDGDQLSLKSTLCQFILPFRTSGSIRRCSRPGNGRT